MSGAVCCSPSNTHTHTHSHTHTRTHPPSPLPPPPLRNYARGSRWSTDLVHYTDTVKNLTSRDFPRGPVVNNPPCNVEDTGSILGWGTKIPYDVGQLSLS